MTNNTMKKFLRMLCIVWSTSLTVLVFAIMLLKIDLVLQILTSTPVVAVICLVFGCATGFIAGAIVCFLNTSKVVDARDAKIKKLQSDLNRTTSNYNNACKALSQLSRTNEQRKKEDHDKRSEHIMEQIMGIYNDFHSEEDEDVNEVDVISTDEETLEDVKSPVETED